VNVADVLGYIEMFGLFEDSPQSTWSSNPMYEREVPESLSCLVCERWRCERHRIYYLKGGGKRGGLA
jgi:hypothetical protein